MISDQSSIEDNIGESAIQITHYARVTWYRTLVIAVLALTAFAAALSAILWPMHGNRIQASFFLSLVGSSLTLFGLVFTLCLIGTQLLYR